MAIQAVPIVAAVSAAEVDLSIAHAPKVSLTALRPIELLDFEA
jgi:hypothetical protein